MPETHLVIPDPHASPYSDNKRFEQLGRLIMDYRPTRIVCLGDFADMPSLSSYDRGRRSFEGKRYKKDIESAVEAQDLLFSELVQWNSRKKRNKEKQYFPDCYLLGGNHDEGRIETLTQLHPELEGTVGIHDLQYDKYWNYVPYKTPVCVDGVWYCHHFPTGVSGEPISGANVARSLIGKTMVSSTVGHNHILDIATQAAPNGTRMWGLSAGCYFDYIPDYARHVAHLWWRGVILKYGVEDGTYDLHLISMKEIERQYG